MTKIVQIPKDVLQKEIVNSSERHFSLV